MPVLSFVKVIPCGKALRLSLIAFLFPAFLNAQTLTGLWTGALRNDSNTVRKDQSFEIALTEYGGKVYGYSRSEFIVDDTLYYILKRVKGTIEGDVCEVKDEEIISYNFRGRLDKGIRVTSTFRRNKSDSTWYLDGTWKTNATKKYYSVSGKVSLSNEKDLSVSRIFPHLEELKLAGDVAFYNERKENPVAVTRVAKPERLQNLFAINRDALTERSDALTAPAQPSAPAVTELPQASIPSVKKQEEGNEKTAVNDIPSNVVNNTVVPKNIVSATVSVNKSLNKPEVVAEKENPDSKIQPIVKSVSTGEQPASVDIAAAAVKQPMNKSVAIVKNKPVENTKDIADPENASKATMNPPVSNVSPIDNNDYRNVAATVKKDTKEQPFAKTVNSQNQPVERAGLTNENKKPDQLTQVSSVTQPVKAAATKTIETNSQVKEKAGVAATVANADKATLPDITEKAAVIAGRKSEFTQVVNFKSDSLLISLYDNGEIDGDTVSVFLNGEVLLSQQGLKSSAIKKTIYIKPGQQEDFTLVMFAESLGKYPPNTGLLVIRDGDDVYNLRFSSDFQKNAGIVFRKRK